MYNGTFDDAAPDVAAASAPLVGPVGTISARLFVDVTGLFAFMDVDGTFDDAAPDVATASAPLVGPMGTISAGLLVDVAGLFGSVDMDAAILSLSEDVGITNDGAAELMSSEDMAAVAEGVITTVAPDSSVVVMMLETPASPMVEGNELPPSIVLPAGGRIVVVSPFGKTDVAAAGRV